MPIQLLFVALFPATLLAQTFYPRLETTEVLVDPAGQNAGHQVVEFTVGNAPVDTQGFVLVAGTTAVPFPPVVLPAGQLLRAHLGAAGTSSTADLYFPTCPLLGATDSLCVFSANQLQNPAALVDFVAWGASPGPLAPIGVLAGRWPNTLVAATLPSQEGASLANRTFARSVTNWIGPDAWYRDTTPTLGLPNDPGMTWNLAQGCTVPGTPPMATTNDVLDSGPWAGHNHVLWFANLPAQPGFLLLAFGSQATGPIDLGNLGMPNCYQHVSLDAVVFVPHALGFAQHAYAVPSAQAFVGWSYYLQALVPDAAAGNALQALVSNALVARIGSR